MEEVVVNGRVQRVGEAFAVLLDQNSLDSLGVAEGDTVTLAKAANDGGRAARGDSLERGRAILGRYRRTFEALAQ